MIAAIDQEAAGGWLTIDLGAIVANWRHLAALAPGAACAAVVKADAYGLGADRVAPALAAAGCDRFFVAHLQEGIRLRALLGPLPAILVLNGIMPGTAAGFLANRLLPVLNAPGQIAEWRQLASSHGTTLDACLQLDTGMSRFGLSPGEAQALVDTPSLLDGIAVTLLMSHLGCADTPASPRNAEQRDAFRRLTATVLPGCRRSLAASSGIFLGPDYHFDLVRPGAALFGVNPVPGAPNPMRPVIRLQGRVVQTRSIAAGDWVGYGARFTAPRDTRIATVAVGYADGFLRSGGGNGSQGGGAVSLPGHPDPLPIVGRISMDCLAVDVGDVAPELLPDGAALDLIGPGRPLDDVAHSAGSIGYEFLTGLGHRYARTYIN